MDKLIIYLGNFDRPDSSAAGKRVYGNALIFCNLGYKVVLIGKNNDNNDINNSPIFYDGDNIIFFSFPNYGLLQITKYIRYVNEVITKVGEPEYIIRYGSPGLAEFDRRLISFCQKRRIKLIADVVDWLPSGGNNVIFNLIKKIDTYLEKGIFNRESAGIITISSYLSRYYKERGCRTVVIPPIVSAYKKNRRSDNTFIQVVYAGVPFRLGKKIKSAAEVKDRLDLAVKGIAGVARQGLPVNFDIYGLTQEQYLTAYPEDAEIVCREEARIKFYGRKNMQTVQEAINNADFTILLRERNRATMAGFPTKIVESLSCGTPVITTDTSDLKKYIVNNETGFFVDISNEENIIKELIKIFNHDKKMLQTMKKHCFESRQFCPDKFEVDVDVFITSLKERIRHDK